MKLFSWLFNLNKKKLKLGLALGSGGALGFAELGAIYAFEQNGIYFDIIAGTSIGSIIGAFIANDYSSTDIFEMLKRVDAKDILNSFMINMDTVGLFRVIDKNIGADNIEELKKPFFAIATQVSTGEEKVFSKGSVAKALCASCCYPPIFKPVVIDGESYIDGAFTNSVPADVVKNNGADYVVGIDLSSHQKKDSFLRKILPSYKSKVEKPWQKGYDYSNVCLHPNLSDYTPFSFNRASEIYEIGYKCAIEQIPKIKKELGLIKKGK